MVASVMAEAGAGSIDRIGTSHTGVAELPLVPEGDARPIGLAEASLDSQEGRCDHTSFALHVDLPDPLLLTT